VPSRVTAGEWENAGGYAGNAGGLRLGLVKDGRKKRYTGVNTFAAVRYQIGTWGSQTFLS
jgi:hypothetical protein